MGDLKAFPARVQAQSTGFGSGVVMKEADWLKGRSHPLNVASQVIRGLSFLGEVDRRVFRSRDTGSRGRRDS